MVQVRIERPVDGAVRIAVEAEKPETLRMLQRDAADLHRALDLAGVPSEGRTISFHAAPAASAVHGDGTAVGSDSRRDGSHTPNGQPDQGSARRQPFVPASFNDETDAAVWHRAGLDITA